MELKRDDPRNAIKGLFVCDYCRDVCKDIEGDDPSGPNICHIVYNTSKFKIGCLGHYCDKPCKHLKEETDLTLDLAVRIIKCLMFDLNKLLITEQQLLDAQ